MGEARRVYLNLTKRFQTVEGQIKAERVAATDLLQKCKALETSPNLQAKPDSAVAVAQKILDTLDKIQDKAMNWLGDFGTEGQVVRKQEGGQSGAAKALDALLARLTKENDAITDTGRECRLSLKNTLQRLGGSPQAGDLLRRLHV